MKHFIVAAFLLTVTLVYTSSVGNVKAVPPLRPLHDFPAHIGSFSQVGGDQQFSQEIMEVLGVDHYIMREYRDQNGYSLWLYIGYYESQAEGQMIHSPKHCMPGGGWNIVSSKEVPVVTGNSLGKVYVNQMVLTKGTEKQMAYFWYQGRGRVVANEYKDRALMVYDSIVRKRSDGALVRITGPGNDPTLDDKEQRKFLKAVFTVISDYLPN